MQLQAGNKIATVCLASVLPQPSDAEIVQQYFRANYQLEVVYDDHIYQWQSPERRAALLLDYLQREDIAMIWALRGGEGSADLIPYLLQAHEQIKGLAPKLFAGFSDITALLVYFAQRYQWPTIHAPGAVQMAKNKITDISKNTIMDLLFGKINQLTFTQLQAYNAIAKQKKIISAQLTGGNLSLLNISIQDSWEVDFNHKIVMLEDVNEKAHSIVRTLKYLQRIGKFTQCQALILGDFMGDNNQDLQEKTAVEKLLGFFADSCDFPVFKTDQFGHGENNLPFIFNKNATLQCGEFGKLVIELG